MLCLCMTSYAQTPTDPDTIDAAFVEEIEQLLEQEEKVQKVEQVVRDYESKMLHKEMNMSIDGVQYLFRGVWLSNSEHKFNDMNGRFINNNTDKRDYLVAATPLVAAWTMKIAGVESRSTTKRMIVSNSMALALTVGIGGGLKYMVKEPRPNGSGQHGMPSGHSALAYMGATVLHREYGHISPWISIGGYSLATGTQYMRLRHNDHWVNDVFVGAGIGTVATNFSYYLADLMFGEKGLRNKPRLMMADIQRTLQYNAQPTSFSLISGIEAGKKELSSEVYSVVPEYDGNINLKTSAVFTAGVEYSYFFNKNLAVEAMGRVATAQVKAETDGYTGKLPSFYNCNIEQYHLDAGIKYSHLVTPNLRVSGRVYGGGRLTEAADMEYKSTGTPFVSIPQDTSAECGGGISIDYMNGEKYAVGMIADYNHTFSKLMPNRWVLGMQWKIIL